MNICIYVTNQSAFGIAFSGFHAFCFLSLIYWKRDCLCDGHYHSGKSMIYFSIITVVFNSILFLNIRTLPNSTSYWPSVVCNQIHGLRHHEYRKNIGLGVFIWCRYVFIHHFDDCWFVCISKYSIRTQTIKHNLKGTVY